MILYSLPTILVAIYSALLGLYAITRPDRDEEHVAFALLCLCTFVWQFSWSILFQVESPRLADALVKIGYAFIFFLPVTIYHFLSIVIEPFHNERRWVYACYAVSAAFVLIMLPTHLFVDGFYKYEWGYYPKAGILHPLHLIMTTIVTSRGLYLVRATQKKVTGALHSQLGFILASMLIFLFASIDYLCNYGWDFYPPGWGFVAASLSLFAFALVKKDLLNIHAELSESRKRTERAEKNLSLLRSMAGNIAHELRTPLANISLATSGMAKYMPEIWRGYEASLQRQQQADGEPSQINAATKATLEDSLDIIQRTVERAQLSISLLLANVQAEKIDDSRFQNHSMRECIETALAQYPFEQDEKALVSINPGPDFTFRGCNNLMAFVLDNLLKNALYALRIAGGGDIRISTQNGDETNMLVFRDTGAGIPEDILPRIFDDFYSTKPGNTGAGLGLAFCKRVMEGFGGAIECESRVGEYTEFRLVFPAVR